MRCSNYVLAACSLIAYVHACAADDQDKSPALAKAKEAWRAAVRLASSAEADGNFRVHDAAGKEIHSAKFTMRVHGGGYFIDLTCLPVGGKPPRYDRVIIINDGTAMIANRFSPRIKPHGCEAWAHLPDSFNAASEGGYNWAPDNIVGHVLNFDKIRAEMTVRELKPGEFALEYDLDAKHTVRADFGEATGFNLSHVALKRKGAEEDILAKYEVDWQKTAEGWHIHSVNRTDSAGMLSGKTELVFTRFKPAIVADENLAQMSALQLRAGCRIIDQRPNVAVRVLRAPDPQAAPLPNVSLKDQLKMLPAR